jgi:hypothetical protein
MSNETYYYLRRRLEFTGDFGLDKELFLDLAVEVFNAWIAEQQIKHDRRGIEVSATIKRNTEGQSNAEVYDLAFHATSQPQQNIARFIIRVHSGPNASIEAEEERAYVTRIYGSGSDLFSSRLLQGTYCLPNAIVYWHAETQASTTLSHLHDYVLQAIRAGGYEAERLADALNRGLSKITNIYDGIGGARKVITGREYFLGIYHRLAPDLIIDARGHNLLPESDRVIIETKYGSMPSHKKVIPTVEAGTLIRQLLRQDGSNKSEWIRIPAFQIAHQSLSSSFLKFESKNVGIWIRTDDVGIAAGDLSKDKPCDIVFDFNEGIAITSTRYLQTIGFHSNACMSVSEFRDICEQFHKVETNFRHTDLHCRNVLAGTGILKVIDLGSAREDLLAIGHARLEISIWRHITEVEELTISDTRKILESLAEDNNQYLTILDPRAKILYKVLLALRNSLRTNIPRGPVEETDMVLAYVSQILLHQRYLIEQNQQEISSTFDAVAQYWIKRLRNIVNNSEEDIASSVEVPAVIERVVEPGSATVQMLWEEAVKSPDGNTSNLSQDFLDNIPDQFLSLMAQPLTNLQNDVWQKRDLKPFHSNRNIIIAAPTSSGKTSVGVMFLAGPPLWNSERTLSIYIAPTRALAQARYQEIRALFFNVPDIYERTVLSTGEDTDTDWRIARGDFAIACMVYEKANVLLAQNLALLDSLGCVVIDEIHMLMNLERGPILEMFLTKLLKHRSSMEFEKRRDSFRENLRVVAISTEEEPDNATKRFLTMFDPRTNERNVTPFIFYDNSRPVRVTHHLILQGRSEEPYTRFKITAFEKSEHRMLPEEKLNEINKRLSDIVRSIRASLRGSGQRVKDNSQKRLIRFLLFQLGKYREGYRALIFVPSRGEVEIIAEEMKKARIQMGPETLIEALQTEFHTSEKFAALKNLSRDAEDKKMAKLLEECAETGIFIHHADVSKPIRREIEKICSLRPSVSQLIFATETLSYGVNLAVNDVILFGAEFNTQSRFRVQKRLFLSGCEFHNMAGRAGRLRSEKTQVVANVYTIVPANKDKDPYRDYIRRYYMDVDSAESQLFISDDKAGLLTAESNILAKSITAAMNDGSPCSQYRSLRAKDFSYPFVRSVLDGLRHVNMLQSSGDGDDRQRIPLKALFEFFDQTLYAQQVLPISGDKEQVLFRCAVECILKDCAKSPLELVEATLGDPVLYKITERGEAIIDTGTEISTVEPMLELADLLHKTWNDIHKDKPFPTDLYVLCLVAQSESFRQYIRNTPECKGAGKRNWHEQMIEANRAAVFQSFILALESIDQTDTLTLASSLRGILEDWAPTRKVPAAYPQGGADSVIRFFNALLAWINGTQHAEVIQLIETYEGPPSGISGINMNGKMHGFPRYTEFLSWKALFLARMRATAKKLIDEHIDERELHLLVARLRLGCTTDAVPLFRPRGSNITRTEAVELLKEKMTPRWILSASHDSKDVPISAEKFRQLCDDLEEYAIDHLNDLKREMTIIRTDDEKRDAIYEFWDQLARIFPSSVEQYRRSVGERVNFDSLLWQSLDFSSLESEGSIDGLSSALSTLNPSKRSSIDYTYRIQIERREEENGLIWIAERYEEELRDYIRECQLKIIAVQIRQDWYGRLGQDDWLPLTDIIEREYEIKNLVLVPLPWIPPMEEIPPELKIILQERLRSSDSSTTFVTPAAFAVILSSLVRGFISGEAFVARFIQGPTNTMFNDIAVKDVLEILDISPFKLPPPVREKLVRHFEVGFEQPISYKVKASN